jgi:hypothetical protein
MVFGPSAPAIAATPSIPSADSVGAATPIKPVAPKPVASPVVAKPTTPVPSTPAPTPVVAKPAAPAPSTPAPTSPAAAAAVNDDAAAPVASSGRTGFTTWRAQRDEIEAKISSDPTLLRRNPTVLAAYRKLQSELFAISKTYAEANRKSPNEVKVNEHLREAEEFEKTKDLVAQLHKKLQ